MLKKIPSDKINGTKNTPTHHSFTLNLRFLYELMCKVRLFKTLCGIFHFRFRSVFIKTFVKIFLFNKMQGLSDFKTS